jgi:hypothetical protein
VLAAVIIAVGVAALRHPTTDHQDT